MILRRLNIKGMESFSDFLDSCSSDDPQEYPEYLIESLEHTKPIFPEIVIEKRNFENRFVAAKYIFGRFDGKNIQNIEYDKGLWSWLALFYFDRLCAKDSFGNYLPKQHSRWILSSDYKTYYRHLLAGPYRIFRAHRNNPESALAVLSTPVIKPGELVEQLASRQWLVSSRKIIEVATILYIDIQNKVVKRGAASKGLGSVRRFVDIMNQLDVTWDLNSMDPAEIIALLPSEFTRFID